MLRKSNAKLHAWLQIIRLPNLFTVPGEPLAGAFLASVVSENSISLLRLCSLVLAILAVYCFGLMQNDLTDYEADLKNRPERPLPRQVIILKEIKLVLIATLVIGLVLAFAAGPVDGHPKFSDYGHLKFSFTCRGYTFRCAQASAFKRNESS